MRWTSPVHLIVFFVFIFYRRTGSGNVVPDLKNLDICLLGDDRTIDAAKYLKRPFDKIVFITPVEGREVRSGAPQG